jgi:hypothetical protein
MIFIQIYFIALILILLFFLAFHSNKSYDNFNIPDSSKYLLNLALNCMILINIFAF